MAASESTTVRVRFNSATQMPEIDPSKKWVHCYWEKAGQEDIRWTFEGFPDTVRYVGVKFLPFVPDKYHQGVPGFVSAAPFLGVSQEKSTVGSHLPDLVTYGNCRLKGYFCYALAFYTKEMKQVFALDPGGTSDPLEPPTPNP